MRIIAFNLFFILFFNSQVFAFDQSHKNWDQVLKNYQNSNGLINYKKLKSDLNTDVNNNFNAYLKEIQSVSQKDFDQFSKQEQMAFLINSYNALTVKLILDHYPVKSIKKIGGWLTKPWSVEFFSLLDGKIKSLDPIEHKMLRPLYKDFRIHSAVNCASISCPPLRNEAYLALKLDKQLDDQMRLWLKDKNRNQINSKSKLWKVSKIFDWYKDDFNQWGGGVNNAINKYLKPSLGPEKLKQIQIEFLDYNWDLNEVK
jgi:hypothetical protein